MALGRGTSPTSMRPCLRRTVVATLARPPVVNDNHPTSLSSIVEWHNGLVTPDVSRLNAVHCTVVKSDLGSVRTLRSYNRNRCQHLRRAPSYLQLESFAFALGINISTTAEVARATFYSGPCHPEKHLGRQPALEELFSAFDPDNGKAPGHSGMNSNDRLLERRRL